MAHVASRMSCWKVGGLSLLSFDLLGSSKLEGWYSSPKMSLMGTLPSVACEM